MNATRRKFKFFVALSLVLIGVFLAVVNVTLTNFFAKKSTPNAAATSTDTFWEQIAEMTSQYPIGEDALFFLDKNEDVVTRENGDYLVTQKTFTALTKTLPDNLLPTANSISAVPIDFASVTEPMYDLNDMAAQLGYTVTTGESQMMLVREFSTKRLIIESRTADIDLRGAVATTHYKNFYIHQYATEAGTKAAYDYYSNHPEVIGVEPDSIGWNEAAVSHEVSDTNNLAPLDIEQGSYSYHLTWGADKMGVPAYSQYLKDTVNSVNKNVSTLPQVVVAIIDGGIATGHPWFKNRFLYDKDGQIIGKSFNSRTSFENDYDGHGTHCAGIICDMTLSNVKILPIKAFYDFAGVSIGLTTEMIAGVQFAIAMSEKCNVVAINMSFSAPSWLGKTINNLFAENIQDAYDAGIFSVVSAGNQGEKVENYNPCNVERAITVSSISVTGRFSDFSNYGEGIDVCAPGELINSAYYKYKKYETIIYSGTSMAAPHVVAYIALLKSDPNRDFSMTDIEQILKGAYPGFQSIEDLGDPGKDIYFGYGLPVLHYAVPDYMTIEITGDHGQVSPSGLNMYSNHETVTLNFTPDYGYEFEALYIDNLLVVETPGLTQYQFPYCQGRHNITVEFKPTGVPYTVNHYLEPIYEDGIIPAGSRYTLHKTEILYGTYNYFTAATAQYFPGFTPVKFAQERITGNTVINIYYTRNKYKVTIETPGGGFANVRGAGYYVYGDTVKLSPTMAEGFECPTWSLKRCTDQNFSQNFNPDVIQPFTMPASDVTLVLTAARKTYSITIDIIGRGQATTQTMSVQYEDSVNFEFTPDTGYKVATVYNNGVDLKWAETSYQIDCVKSNVRLTVVFVQSSPDLKATNTTWLDITLYFITCATVIITGLVWVVMIIVRHSVKRSKP